VIVREKGSSEGWNRALPAAMRVIYNGWVQYQANLADMLRGLSDEQLGLRPASGDWAVWQIASHMAGARMYWFHVNLGQGDPALAGMFKVQHTTVPGLPLEHAGWEDDEDHPRSAGEIVDALERTWRVIEDCLERWTPRDLELEFIQQPAEPGDVPLSRAWVIWHLIEHEVHHGGQISLILGSNGIPVQDI
jgi:uncharacterized damage-inducible protein DinB